MMQCTISHSCHDDEYNFYREMTVPAHKELKCEECNKTIVSGEKRRFVVGLTAGGHSFKSNICTDCWSIIFRFCDGWMGGQMWEDLAQAIYDDDVEISPGMLDGLSPLAARMMAEMLDDVFQDMEDADASR